MADAADTKRGTVQWFRGQLEGHCVGVSSGRPVVSQFGSARRFKLRIYRAVIRDVEVLDSRDVDEAAGDGSDGDGDSDGARAPGAPEGCYYQARIDDARIIGLRPRRAFEGSVYDVAVDHLRITHSTSHGGKTYGRVVGEIYGRCRVPPDPAPGVKALTATHDKRTVPGSEDALATDDATADSDTASAASADPSADASAAPSAAKDTGGPIDPLHPPTPAAEPPWQPADVPAGFLVVVVGIVLALTVGWTAALFWFGYFTPIMLIRYMLHGMFKANDVHRIIGALLVLVQAVCLASITFAWWTSGCKSMSVPAIAGIGGTLLLASILPSVTSMLFTGAGFALALVFAYGDFGTPCEPPPAPPAEPAIAPPTVEDPGIPRTNDDGSWPRRSTPR